MQALLDRIPTAMAPAAGASSRAPGRKGGGDEHDSADTAAAGGVAATLAGLTRMLIFSLKGTLKKGILKAFLRKKAFMAIGERTGPAAILSEHLTVSQGNIKAAGRQSSFQSTTLGRSSCLSFLQRRILRSNCSSNLFYN